MTDRPIGRSGEATVVRSNEQWEGLTELLINDMSYDNVSLIDPLDIFGLVLGVRDVYTV